MTKKKPASLTGLLAKKGKAESANTYIGDEPPAPDPKAEAIEQIDGRSLRKTGRTFKFAATVHPQWAADLKTIAFEDDMKIVEVLEAMLSEYQKQRRGRK